MIRGFKCFNKGLINSFNDKFELNKQYIFDGDINFRSGGFHFCKNVEDTLRYFDAMNNDVDICEVIGSGKVKEFSDEYYGYYDMYTCSKIILIKIYSREELIQLCDKMIPDSFMRFASGYRLTKEELEHFKNKYANNMKVIDHLTYYYEDKKIYEKKYGGYYG